MTQVPNITLSNGVKMPALGLGVFQMTQEENERTYAELMKPFAQVWDFVNLLS